jgi:hypothetical protein
MNMSRSQLLGEIEEYLADADTDPLARILLKEAQRSLARARSYQSEVGALSDGSPVIVGWDVCSECHLHVTICDCSTGPTEPPYVTKFRNEDARERQFAQTVTSVTTGKSGQSRHTPGDLQDDISTGTISARTVTGPTCRTCKTTVSSETADKNDDGSWTCHVCQEESAK